MPAARWGKEVGVARDTLKSTGIVDQGSPCCGSSWNQLLFCFACLVRSQSFCCQRCSRC